MNRKDSTVILCPAYLMFGKLPTSAFSVLNFGVPLAVPVYMSVVYCRVLPTRTGEASGTQPQF